MICHHNHLLTFLYFPPSQADFNAILEDSHRRQHDFFGSPYGSHRQRPKLSQHSDPSRSFNSASSFDSEADESFECCTTSAGNLSNLDHSVYASEIAAAMGIGGHFQRSAGGGGSQSYHHSETESGPGSGLQTQFGSLVDSQEFLADIEYIDDQEEAEQEEEEGEAQSEDVLDNEADYREYEYMVDPVLPRIVPSYHVSPSASTTTEYDVNESTDYSSGQFLLVPGGSAGAGDVDRDGGDSDCDFSTQTVIRVPLSGSTTVTAALSATSATSSPAAPARLLNENRSDDTDSDNSNDSDILEDLSFADDPAVAAAASNGSDYKQLISSGARRKSSSSGCRRESTSSSAKLADPLQLSAISYSTGERRQSSMAAIGIGEHHHYPQQQHQQQFSPSGQTPTSEDLLRVGTKPLANSRSYSSIVSSNTTEGKLLPTSAGNHHHHQHRGSHQPLCSILPQSSSLLLEGGGSKDNLASTQSIFSLVRSENVDQSQAGDQYWKQPHPRSFSTSPLSYAAERASYQYMSPFGSGQVATTPLSSHLLTNQQQQQQHHQHFHHHSPSSSQHLAPQLQASGSKPAKVVSQSEDLPSVLDHSPCQSSGKAITSTSTTTDQESLITNSTKAVVGDNSIANRRPNTSVSISIADPHHLHLSSPASNLPQLQFTSITSATPSSSLSPLATTISTPTSSAITTTTTFSHTTF